MKRRLFILLAIVSFISLAPLLTAYSEDIKKEDCFFLKSLHYTTRGMSYWYDKAKRRMAAWKVSPVFRIPVQNSTA